MGKKSKTQSIVEVIESVEEAGFSKEEYILKLEQDNTVLQQSISRLAAKASDLEDEVIQLKKMLFDSTPVIEGLVGPLTDEEIIANLQLRRLLETAKQGKLNLEDVKIFDLLVKNKRLAQGKVTDIQGKKSLPDKTPTATLVQIASHKKTEERS